MNMLLRTYTVCLLLGFGLSLCTKAAAASAAPIVVSDGRGGTSQIDAAQLGAATMFRVHIACYDEPGIMAPGPVSPEARLVSDQTVNMQDGFSAEIESSRSVPGQRTMSAMPESATDGMLIRISSNVLSPEGRTLAGHSSRRQERLAAAGDIVNCCGLTLQIYSPGANRYEVTVESYQRSRDVVPAVDGGLPQLVETDSPATVLGWTSGNLRAIDLGYLFEDGTPAIVITGTKD
jgi:hypothetical protein